MKKKITYYFDEDDAVPIRRKKVASPKKAPQKAATYDNDEAIRFTPNKNLKPAQSYAKKADSTATENSYQKEAILSSPAASVKRDPAPAHIVEAAERNEIEAAARAAAVSEKKKSAVTPNTKIAPSTPRRALEDPALRPTKTNAATSEKIQIAEIPYNREYGRINTASEASKTNTAKVKAKAENVSAKKAAKKNESAPAPAYMPASKKKNFKVPFIIYTAVLLILSLCAILYVRGLLLDYEASQPENFVQNKIDEMKTAFEKGTPEKVVSLNTVMEQFSPTEEDLDKFTAELLASDVTYKKINDTSDPSKISYDILSDKYKIAKLTMASQGKKTKLVIFSMDQWVVESFEITGYTANVTLPASLTVKNGDTVIEGVPSEDGKTANYTVSSLTAPAITFTDALGNTLPYSDSGDYKFTEYLISVPSNYTVKGKDTIPLSYSTLEDIGEYKYVSEYCDTLPKMAHYSICVMSDTANITVYDNLGNPVDITEMGNSFEIHGQTGSDTLPENVAGEPDPLERAKQWSLFMTDDLTGQRHGFYKMEKYLIADSYMHEVAWDWATGVDITFTSPHTLAKNPFTTADIGNFVAYSDTCFSCDILLEKPMYITRANTVIDTMHSTFYFVLCDDTDDGKDNPHWAIADIKEITE